MTIDPNGLREIQRRFRPILLLHLDFTKDEQAIRRWVRWCDSLGYGGFGLICETKWDKPRMDESWYEGLLSAAQYAVEEAETCGLDVWIFDEWGYPSGTAAGLVCENPDYRSKKLHIAHDVLLAAGESTTFTAPQRLLSVGAIPVNKYAHYAPGGPCVPIPCASGETVHYTARRAERVVAVTWEPLSFITHAARENSPEDYALGTIDLLNPRAVRRFTEVMHDAYYARLSKFFGTVIKGFFYDEPELSFDMPWTQGLEHTFLERKGYDLCGQLPILLCYSGVFYHPGWPDAHAHIAKLHQDYRDVWTEALARGFYAGVRDWCHAHGIASIGHQDRDNHAQTLCSVSGDFFRNNVYNDHPGIDVIWDQIELGRYTDFPRFAGSAKRLLGKPRAVSETFAEMGLAQYPDRMRYALEQQIVRGVDEFVLMISEVEPDEDALHCFSPGDVALSRFGAMVNAHVGRAAQLSQTGVPGAHIAVFAPIRAIYAHQQRMRDGHTLNAKLPWDALDEVARALCYLPCDFDYLWEDALLALPLREGAFCAPGGSRIDTLIVPQSAQLSPDVLERLKAFARAGGRVLGICAPCLDDEGLFEYVADAGSLPEAVRTPVRAHGEGMISLCHRVEGNTQIYLLLNESRAAAQPTLTFPPGDLFEMDLLTGQLRAVSRGGDCALRFEKGELRAFVQPGGCGAALPEAWRPARVAVVRGVWLTLPDGSRRALDACAMPAWDELGYAAYSGDMIYTLRFALPEAAPRVRLALGELCYCALVSLDGGERIPLAFAPFVCEFPDVRAGEHEVTLVVRNTQANRVIGDRQTELARFHGHTPAYLNIDRKYLRSGLFGPIEIGY